MTENDANILIYNELIQYLHKEIRDRYQTTFPYLSVSQTLMLISRAHIAINHLESRLAIITNDVIKEGQNP